VLEKVEILTEQGLLLELPLEDISSGYSVQNIDGLDPVKATIVSSSYANADGEQYQSSRREKRNIILTLGYEPDYVVGTTQSLRSRLMRHLMPKSRVLLRFYHDDLPMVQIWGRVESFDSPKFVKEPQAVISIINFDPDFYDPNPVVIPGMSTSSGVPMSLVYPGTVETGIILRVMPDRAISEFGFFTNKPDNTNGKLEYVGSLIAGDVVTISTIFGNKSVTLTRGNVVTSVLFNLNPLSEWINLFPGENHPRVYVEGAAIPYQIEYTTKYGGL
jgi:hypothetical protein